MKDGGEVALDWQEAGCAENAPIIIILPGLTGESQAEYIKCLVVQANCKGMKCVVFNNRGLGGMALKTPRCNYYINTKYIHGNIKNISVYCAANCEDLSEVVKHVHHRYPNVKKGATGISMGGLILGMKKTYYDDFVIMTQMFKGNYLSTYSEEAKTILTAANIISVPWDVEKGKWCVLRFEQKQLILFSCQALFQLKSLT